MAITLINRSNNVLPLSQATQPGGFSLRALLAEEIVLQPGHEQQISTGIFVELTDGATIQMRVKGKLKYKHQIELARQSEIRPGGPVELTVSLVNRSDKPFTINNGDDIAEMTIIRNDGVLMNK